MSLFQNPTTYYVPNPVSTSGDYVCDSSNVYIYVNNKLQKLPHGKGQKTVPPITKLLSTDQILLVVLDTSIIVRIKSGSENVNQVSDTLPCFDDEIIEFNQNIDVKMNSLNDTTFISILQLSEVVVLKYENNVFVDRYNIILNDIKHISFISETESIIMRDDKPDVIHVDLISNEISHFDISNILKFKSSFFNLRKDKIIHIDTYPDHILILKTNQLFDLTFNKKSTHQPISTHKIHTLKRSKFITVDYPFVLIDDHGTSVCSVNDLAEFEKIPNTDCPVFFDNLRLKLVDDWNIIDYKMKRPEELFNSTDFSIDNMILLAQTLPMSNRFAYVRKFKLLKAQSIISTDFTKAIDLMIDYFASPQFVIDNLPSQLLHWLGRGELLDDVEVAMIDDLIRYFTDSRRKLVRLQNDDYITMNEDGKELSLEIYQSLEKFDLQSNLKLIDEYLFKCYLLTNKKMIVPFLRRNVYCDDELIENTCKDQQLNEQLVTFYSTKKMYTKCVEILEDHEQLVIFFQKLIQMQNHSIDLIFNHIDVLNEGDNFKRVFLNDDLDYSYIDYKEILEKISNSDLQKYKTEYLAYLVFTLNQHDTELINPLFQIYFEDVPQNFKNIQKLYDIGIFKSNPILKKLQSMPMTNEIKQLMIPPLTKLRRYDDVLNIYVKDLHDVGSAITFCQNIRTLKNDSLSKGLVFKIIELCLLHKDYSSIIDHILNNAELDFINFEEILLKLPKDMSMNLMSKYLVMNLKNLNSINNNIIIKNEVLKTNLIDTQLNKQNLERKMTRLSQDSTCCRCNHPFNKSEILCFQPNGSILHYKCSKQTV